MCVNYYITLQRRRGRRAKKEDEEEAIKRGEVIHVRAKRGQATDSHSLAERVRFLIYVHLSIQK